MSDYSFINPVHLRTWRDMLSSLKQYDARVEQITLHYGPELLHTSDEEYLQCAAAHLMALAIEHHLKVPVILKAEGAGVHCALVEGSGLTFHSETMLKAFLNSTLPALLQRKKMSGTIVLHNALQTYLLLNEKIAFIQSLEDSTEDDVVLLHLDHFATRHSLVDIDHFKKWVKDQCANLKTCRDANGLLAAYAQL